MIMENDLITRLERDKIEKIRISYFVAGMKWGAKCMLSKLPEVQNAVDFDEFDKQYKEENNEGI
jgi:hypothetical protein